MPGDHVSLFNFINLDTIPYVENDMANDSFGKQLV